jgi:hypothetical protein
MGIGVEAPVSEGAAARATASAGATVADARSLRIVEVIVVASPEVGCIAVRHARGGGFRGTGPLELVASDSINGGSCGRAPADSRGRSKYLLERAGMRLASPPAQVLAARMDDAHLGADGLFLDA